MRAIIRNGLFECSVEAGEGALPVVHVGDSAVGIVKSKAPEVCRGHCEDRVHKKSVLHCVGKSNRQSGQETERTSRGKVMAT
jgi:hypothetical protein